MWPGVGFVGEQQNLNRMKTHVALFVVALMLACHGLFAQDKMPTYIPPRWIQLTDSIGQVIGLREDQLQGWRKLNDKWSQQYGLLGEHPTAKPTYIKLHGAREFDLKGFLTGGQYDKWEQLNKRSPRLEGGNPPGTDMPSDR